MRFSKFGEKFTASSGTVELMDDLGVALSERPDMIFMGGGNPSRITAVEEAFATHLKTVLDDPVKRHTLFGIYQSPRGDRLFRQELAAYFRKQCGWQIGERNIAIANGSQTAFFALYNLLAGEMSDGTHSHIHLPVVPEYLGYADVGVGPNLFRSSRPNIDHLENHLFKYRVDFDALQLNEHAAAVCVSRPTNPTGNVLTNNEVAHLDDIAQANGVPFIIDGAYGLPFPGIISVDASPHWNENTILVLSLSKLGLPGVRTGIVIASEEIVTAFSRVNTIMSLASATLGPVLGTELLQHGVLDQLTAQHIAPYYRERARQTVDAMHTHFAGLPYHVHVPEGAFFVWLWLEGLPIPSKVLYEELKARGVLVVPGESFFIGLEDDWPHSRECLRISYAQDPETVNRGLEIIGAACREAYDGAQFGTTG